MVVVAAANGFGTVGLMLSINYYLIIPATLYECHLKAENNLKKRSNILDKYAPTATRKCK